MLNDWRNSQRRHAEEKQQLAARAADLEKRLAEAERALAADRAARDLGEMFDRRGTEPFELFRSEFDQNSRKIEEFSPENSKNSGNFNIF